MNNRVLRAVILIVVCTALGAATGIFTTRYYHGNEPQKARIEGLLWPNPRVLQQFSAIDQDGKNFGLENLSGKWTFLFFGYTHCPDICPVTLTVLDQVYKKLATGPRENNVQVVFVTVDPERDTPGVIKSYMAYFNKDFIGLTGTEEQIDSLATQIGIVHTHTKETASGDYLVDHTASVFLISPDDKLLGIFSPPHTADDMVSRYHAINKFIKNLNS